MEKEDMIRGFGVLAALVLVIFVLIRCGPAEPSYSIHFIGAAYHDGFYHYAADAETGAFQVEIAVTDPVGNPVAPQQILRTEYIYHGQTNHSGYFQVPQNYNALSYPPQTVCVLVYLEDEFRPAAEALAYVDAPATRR